jgi:hypothetical protein
MSKRTLLLLSCVLIAVFTVVPIVFYLLQFQGGLSNKQEDWGAFADYLNVFISILNIVFIALLTYSIYRYQKEDEQNKSIPILIFKVNRNKKWAVQNVGKGVALNILVSYTEKKDQWLKPVKVYSIIEGQEIELGWFKASLQCGAEYFDMNGNVYKSICKNDDTEFIKDSSDNRIFENFNGEYDRYDEVSKMKFTLFNPM